ncbi:amidase [Halomonas salipaludis]|nr:amidase [Halomonas salipaludis]
MASPLLATQPAFSDLAKDFRDGSRSPRDYLELCIEAIENREGLVKAFTYYDFEQARERADASSRRYAEGRPLSPIDGMPVGIKDIIDTRDMPTEMNSSIFIGHRPLTDAACVRAINEGGAFAIGKTVTTEFAIGRSGPTTNPHNPEHTPGGSSSGTAAGVAAGMFPAGFGTQTQGSIIRPASFCGVVGFKPTLNSLSLNGVHPLSKSHDHLGVIADSVDDAWWLARWVSEYAPEQCHPGLSGPLQGPVAPGKPANLAVLRTNGFEDLDATSLSAFEQQLDALRLDGITLVEPENDPLLQALVDALHDAPERSLELLAYEMRWPFQDYVEKHPNMVGERIHGLMESASRMTRAQYRQLLIDQYQLKERLQALAGDYDAFILPAASGPAPHGFEFTGSRRLLVYSTLLGAPAFSVPRMTAAGMPFGLQLVGFPGQDYHLARQARWMTQRN